MRCLSSGSTGENLAGLVEGGEVEGVGGELDIGDDAAGFVDGERQFYPTPVELSRALGGEGAPMAITPLIGGELLIDMLYLRFFDYLRLL